MGGIAAEVGEGVQELLGCGLGAGVGSSDFEVLLNESRGGSGGRGLRVCDEAQACDVNDDDDDSRDGEGRASEAALADTDADEPESVDRGDDKGEAVGSGDGGEPCQ